MCYVPLVLRETELYLTTKQSNDIHSLQMATPNNIHTSTIHNSCVYECLYDHLILELPKFAEMLLENDVAFITP